MDMVSMQDVIQNTNHLLPKKKKARNGYGEHKHVIQNTTSLTNCSLDANDDLKSYVKYTLLFATLTSCEMKSLYEQNLHIHKTHIL